MTQERIIMEKYIHKFSALYHNEALARQALQQLQSHNFSDEQLRLIGPNDADVGNQLEPEGDEIPKEVIRDTLVGAGIGGGVGAASTAVLAAETVLFATNPILGGLMAIGYATTIGGLAGAIKGLKVKETIFVGVVEQALRQGSWALVVHAQDKEQEEIARRILGETVADAVDTINN
jgi:hypothetical protein